MRKFGHRYVTVIVIADIGRTLAIVEHRSCAALSALIVVTGPLVAQRSQSRRHRLVVAPTRPPWLPACPIARHVLDCLHVIRLFAADACRGASRHPAPRLPHGVKIAFDPELFRVRFLLLRARIDYPHRRRPVLAWNALC